jgi:hypothetical protein
VPDPDNEEWVYRTGQEVAVEERVFVEGERGVAVGAAAHARLDLTLEEVCIVQNALNEVCNGLDLQNEFETRIGATLATVRKLCLNVLPQSDGNQECNRRYGNYDYKKAKGAFSLSRSRPCFPIFEDPVRDPDHN